MFAGDISVNEFVVKYENQYLTADELLCLYSIVSTFLDEVFEANIQVDPDHLVLLYLPLRRIAINFIKPHMVGGYRYNRFIEKKLYCTLFDLEIDDDASIDAAELYIKYSILDARHNINQGESCYGVSKSTETDQAVLVMREYYADSEKTKREIDVLLGI